MSTLSINKAIMKMSKRSEKADITDLLDTFVDVGPLFTLLDTYDNQIIYGRRGTGKTHALIYLSGTIKNSSHLPVYIDLSNLGSSGGIYSDSGIPLHERASRLLVDTLLSIHEGLFEFFISEDERFDLSQVGLLLDKFADSITEVRVVGEIEHEVDVTRRQNRHSSLMSSIEATPTSAKFKFDTGTNNATSEDITEKSIVRGQEKHTIHFGTVRRTLEKIVKTISPHRLFVLLDEWSSIPPDLQPYLADLFRRSFFPIRGITAKIAAIEYRSTFQIPGPQKEYIGFELGADIATNINLDDFMVFDNNPERAREFYQTLFYRHLARSQDAQSSEMLVSDGKDFVNKTFTQKSTFDELVRASEGVPRDAINIASLSAQYSMSDKISIPTIRKAAQNWYQQGKESAITSREPSLKLLHWIIQKVIGERKARAFLLKSNTRHSLIDDLFDSRVLHILKKNISSHDTAGIRYDVYKLDYGCYVDLMNTVKAPTGLLPAITEGEFTEVPPDDYRAIRRAILDLSEFEATL